MRSQREDLRILNVRGGARMSVPEDLDNLTTYILLEQEDWFEDEIRFVRRWLSPGMHAVDIGASLGVYTATMAQAVGRDGRIWAFEPTPQSADLLQRTLSLSLLERIAGRAYRLPEMERRRQLVRMRAGLQSGPEPHPILCARSDENLNPEFWCAAGAQ